MTLARLATALEARLDSATRWGGLLVLPLSLLLAAQWPLRDLVGAGSRQANDIAQWIFAVYVALALRHATHVRGHMSTDALAARYAPATRRAIARWGEAVCVLPWAVYVLIVAAAPSWQSLRQLEAFPETFNPLYFIVKCSVWLLALLVALQALVRMFSTAEAT